MKMQNRFFAGLAAATMIVAGSAEAAEDATTTSATKRKPNVILIVSDDHGYAEIGPQGNKDVPTPQIDSIARAGIRFTNGYVSCPVCSPTRAGLMTGRYQSRFGHELNPGPAGNASTDFGLPLSEKTLANEMKALGYATGIVGKWHLGHEPKFHPMSRGFDEFFGFLGGAHPYVNYGSGTNAIMQGREPFKGPQEYLTTAFGREASAFVERHKSEPFFLYLPFNAVHSPLQAPKEYLDKFASISDPKRRSFAAMLSAMDDAIGAVLAKVRELKLEENTLIFFHADNGGPTPSTTSANDPLRGTKGTVFEGGIRVPFLVQWKGQLPAGKVYDQPVISLDILPTAVSAAGGKPAQNLDGVNLLPFLKDASSTAPHQQLFWRFGKQWAVRKGDWKLLFTGEGKPQLYNLAMDISEKKDLAASEPTKVAELQKTFDEWNAQLVKPLWEGKGRFMAKTEMKAADKKADKKKATAGKAQKGKKARRQQKKGTTETVQQP